MPREKLVRLTSYHAVVFAVCKMATAKRELLAGQPGRKKDHRAREFAVKDKGLQAQIKLVLRSCLLKQHTWYVTERSLLVAIQTNLKRDEADYKLVEIYDTLLNMNPLQIAAQIGAERCPCKSSIYHGFYWGGLTAGDIPKPTVDFHDLLPLQQLLFENEEVVEQLVDPDRREGAREGAEVQFLKNVFEKHAWVLAGYSATDWVAMDLRDRNRITSAQSVRRVEWTRIRLGVMIAAGALEKRAGEGLREVDYEEEVESTEAAAPAQPAGAEPSEHSEPSSPTALSSANVPLAETTVKSTPIPAADPSSNPFEGVDESALAMKIAVMFKDGALSDTLDRSATVTQSQLRDHTNGVSEDVLRLFRVLGTTLYDYSIQGGMGSAQFPTRTGHEAAADSIKELQQLGHAALGKDWLVVLLAALAGHFMPDRTEKQKEQAELVAIVCAELIRKCANAWRVKPLQKMVAGKLDANCTPGPVREMLERFGLAQARQSLRRGEEIKCDHLAESAAQLELPLGSLTVSLSDNIGYKKGGAMPVYVQYTSRFFRTFTEQELDAAGITSASTVPRPYQQVFKSTQDILPSGGDYATVQSMLRARIQTVIKLHTELGPDADILDTQVADEFEMGTRDIPEPPTMPVGAIKRQVERPLTDGEKDATEPGAWRDRYGGVTFPEPWQLDFSKASTIHKLAQEQLDFLDKMIAEDEWRAKEAGCRTRTEAIERGFYRVQTQLNATWLLSDGSPHYTVRRMIDADPDRWGRLRFHGGSFHGILEDFRCAGRLFGAALTSDLIHGWRDTEGKKRWFLEPGNWVQTAEETPEIVDGLIFEAACEAQRTKTDGDVTEAEVWQHMVGRAKEQPMAAIILLYILIHETIMTAVASESCDDFEMFQLSRRIMLLVYAVTNAFRYVRTTIEQRIEWETASPAEYLINKCLLFTFPTDYGKRIFPDRYVEWFQNDLRKFTGHDFGAGRHEMIRRATLNMRAMLNLKESEGRNSHRFDSFAGLNDDGNCAGRRTVTDIMLITVDYARGSQLWQLRKPLIDKQGAQPMGSFCTLDGKRTQLDPAFLDVLFTAEERVQQSFGAYYLPKPLHIDSRPEETNNRFRTVSALASAETETRVFAWARDYSDDFQYLSTAKQGARKCLKNKDVLTALRAYRAEYGDRPWAVSFPDETKLTALSKSTDPKPEVALLVCSRVMSICAVVTARLR